MSEITAASSESPFDGLMGEDGRWSARDLQEPAGYSKWQDFESAIQRAERAITNTEGAVSAGRHVIMEVRNHEDATAFGGVRKVKGQELKQLKAELQTEGQDVTLFKGVRSLALFNHKAIS